MEKLYSQTWRLFFREETSKEESSDKSKEIDLSNLGSFLPKELRDQGLEARKASPVTPLSSFQVVNLSKNPGLFGEVEYSFSKSTKKVNLSACMLKSLKCIFGLQYLESLNVSSNQLTLTIEDLGTMGTLRSLTHLDISKNNLKEVIHLVILDNLTELNVSENQIQSLAPLTRMDLKILTARKNPLKGLLKDVLPSYLAQLESLDISEYGEDLQPKFDSSDITIRFPQLNFLKLSDEPEAIMDVSLDDDEQHM